MRIPGRAWLAYTLLVSAGCSRGEPTVPVEGKVLVDGKPLTVGTVIFTPDRARGNTSQFEPRGKIDEEGTYRATTTKDGSGVPPGWYKISVSAQRLRDPKDVFSYQSVIPTKYANPDSSGLALEVVEHPAPGAYDITLSSKQ